MTAVATARLLAGLSGDGRTLSLVEHEAVHGPLPRVGAQQLIELVHRSGLRGRGGADFPTAVKLRTVARRRSVSALVVNGSETEPASGKDRLLLERLPHLVLDGAELVADAVGADELIVKLAERSVRAHGALERAIEERGVPGSRIVSGPDGYVSGEETAVVQTLNGRGAKPTFVPPRPHERGYRNRPTLIQNPETLAHIGLIARHGDRWYRQLGTEEDPGTVLLTVSGAVGRPSVLEVPFGTSLADVLAQAGGTSESLQAVLIGGWFGTWVAASDALGLRLTRVDLRRVGAALGAGVLVALGVSSDGLAESARIARYLAQASVGQCGPCFNGLPAIAEALGAVAAGAASPAERARLLRWCVEVQGRGACHHPDGVARFVQSAMAVFDQVPVGVA